MLISAVVTNLFYLWIGAAVLVLLWIPLSFHAFRKRGRFTIMPNSGSMPGPDIVGSTRQALYIFTAVRIAVIIVCVVRGVAQIH
jgi:hypothetical protein